MHALFTATNNGECGLYVRNKQTPDGPIFFSRLCDLLDFTAVGRDVIVSSMSDRCVLLAERIVKLQQIGPSTVSDMAGRQFRVHFLLFRIPKYDCCYSRSCSPFSLHGWSQGRRRS